MYFCSGESAINAKYYVVRTTIDFLEKLSKYKPVRGSFHVFAARLFGLTPTDFLKFVSSEYNAKLYAQPKGYIIYYFNSKKECDIFVKELNDRMEKIFKMLEEKTND